MSEDVKEKYKIDKFNLDEEVNRQVDLMDEIGEKHAFLEGNKEATKLQLDILKAELDNEIRQEYSQSKITEKRIENLIIMDPVYQKKYKEYLKWKKEASIAGNEKEMAMQRRAFLKLLGELWIASYYGDPEIKEVEETKNIRGRRK